MPARIIVEAGAQAGQEFPIEEVLLFLGSGPRCKPRLSDPGMPEHAATVEYKNRRYRVFNKTDRPIKIDTQSVEVLAARDWLPGQRLVLGSVVLRLDIDGDPAPARRVAAVVRGADVVSDTSPVVEVKPGEKGDRKKLWQMIGIGAGIVVVALSFVFAPGEEDSGKKAEVAGMDIDTLINDLRKEEGDDPTGQPVWRLLSDARVFDLRGLKPDANRRYRDVTIMLRQRRGETLEQATDLEKKAEAYARRKLDSED